MEYNNMLKLTFLLLCVLCMLKVYESAPVDENIDEDHERDKRFAIPWLNGEHDLDTRGKNDDDEPEFTEEVKSNFFDIDGEYRNEDDDDIDEETNYHEKRGKKKNKNNSNTSKGSSNVDIVKRWTVYLPNGTEYTETIQNLCLHGHNLFRKKHVNTPPVRYDNSIAYGAEQYSRKLALENKFEHDRGISGKLGENLYRMDNTYNLIATAIHAIFAWYEESWITLNNVREHYNYNWNPQSIQEFSNKGVGHFTQFVWNDSVLIGCGAARTHYYDSNNRKWTRTVFTTRYKKPGNVLRRFPDHIFRLKGKDTLENMKRGKLYPVERKKKNNPVCVNTVPPAECSNWKKYNWCDREWAKRDCHCTCDPE